MRVAARTFSITPRANGIGQSLTLARIERVVGPLQTTVTLLEENDLLLCIISSHAVTDFYRFCNVLRPAVGRALKIDPSRVLCFSSHNHCALHPFPPDHEQAIFGRLNDETPLTMEELTPEGRTIIDLSCRTAGALRESLEKVEVFCALGHERRISYNRKGHRADGSTYMIRETDRLLLGADFNGDIDDDAPIVAFVGRENRVVCMLASFTAHPATAYHPEHPIIFGEYPQIAGDALADAFDGAPVGFLQGCAGDVNAKGVVGDKPIEQSIADATTYGHHLGETFVQAARSMRRCASQHLGLSMRTVRLPFTAVPPREELQSQIADMDSFLDRCAKGDGATTMQCQGLNFPQNMTPRYRAALVEPLLRWARWAIGFHDQDRLGQAPTGVDSEIAAIRIGDVGIVGLPCEPFDAIGRQIKRDSPCALTIPCGYMNDDYVFYVPNSGNNGDLDYQSAFYRYTTSLLPCAQPAGDRLADEAVRMLRELMSQ